VYISFVFGCVHSATQDEELVSVPTRCALAQNFSSFKQIRSCDTHLDAKYSATNCSSFWRFASSSGLVGALCRFGFMVGDVTLSNAVVSRPSRVRNEYESCESELV